MTNKDIDLANEIWLLFNKPDNLNKDKDKNSIDLLNDKHAKIILAKMKDLKIIVAVEGKEDEYIVPLYYDSEQYKNAVIFGIKSSFLENKVSKENKDLAIEFILNNKINDEKIKNEKVKFLKKQKIEDLKSKNWLLILNDIKKVNFIFKNENSDLNNNLIFLNNLKKEFYFKLKEYFKK